MKSRTSLLRAQRDPRILQALPWALALCFGAPAGAQINPSIAGLPMGGTVAAGSVSSAQTAERLTLTQSGNRAILDWQSFNIAAGRTVQFVQPGASAAVLNRVSAGAGLSEIHGSLQANGMVLLMNPNGVLFGNGANVNVGALIATTGTVDPTRFMDQANPGFVAISGATGTVHNQGQITVQNAGLVALVAPSVRNDGQITATGGRIALAGSDRATVSLNGGLYEFALPAGAAGALVSNAAGARLEGAQLLLSTGDAAGLLTGTINLEGVLQASGALVVDGGTVQLRAVLDAPALSGNARRVEVSPDARVADAVKIARTGSAGDGATVALLAGEHTQPIVLDKANLTLQGEAGARLIVSDLAEVNGISIRAHHLTVENLEIAGPVNQAYADYYATTRPNISRGIAVADGVTGFTLRNNDLHDLRTGILVHGRNSTGSITGNRIENTKSGVSVQYTDGSGITIAGNTQGPVGNEWGVNLHLNGHLDGSGNILSNSPPIAAAPGLGWQQALLDLSAANSGWSVQDQGYTSANRTHVQVAGAGTAGNQGSVLTPINTVQGGINAVVRGGRVTVAPGSYTQTATLNINKPLTLIGAGQAQTTLDARGITAGYGMLVTADNVTLRDFTFYGPSASYAAAYGIKVSPAGNADARLRNFSITNVTSRGAGRAELDLNGVDGALIDHVTLDGAAVSGGAGSSAGAGLQLTDSANITVRHSTTRNNDWGGVALYQANRSYNQRTNNVRIEGNNQFNELNPVYLQDESALHDFGSLDIAGLAYAVRNNASAGSSQYTWLQATQQNAYDFAVNLPSLASSTVQGWSGTGLTQRFEVGVGNLQAGGSQAMSISAAIARADSGATVAVADGNYAEQVQVERRQMLQFGTVTLQGLRIGVAASGAGMAGQVTVNGAAGITLDGDVQLLGDTRLATTGSDIRLNGDVQNAAGVARDLRLVAGSGSSWGNVSMRSGGTQGDPLKRFEVQAHRYSLSDTLWVQSYQIDALGTVALSAHTLRALDATASNTLNAGGDVTGSTISLGSVVLQSSGNVAATISASGNASVAAQNISGSIAGAAVLVAAQGSAQVEVVATQSATLAAASVVGSISAPVAAVASGGSVQLALQAQNATVRAEGGVSLSGTASNLSLDAPAGTVSGNFAQVNNTGDGVIKVNGRAELKPELTQTTDNNRIVPGRGPRGDASASAAPPERPLGAVPVFLASGLQVTRSSTAGAATLLERGQAVEIDLAPGNTREEP